MSKGRHTPPPTPEQLQRGQVTSYRALHPDGPEWSEAEQNRTLDSNQIVVGVLYHIGNNLHQVWISLYGTDVTSWAAFRDQARADQFAGELQELFSNWTYTEGDIERMNALLHRGHTESDAEPLPFTDDQVRQIAVIIAEIQRCRN